MRKPSLVIGRGMVGSLFANNHNFKLVSHHQWPDIKIAQASSPLTNPDFAAYIYTAGVAGSNACDKHDMQSIMKANVTLPLEMMHTAQLTNVPLIVFSTTSLYTHIGSPRRETDDVHPHNRYTASKIAMEYALLNAQQLQPLTYQNLFILRVPFLILFDGDFNFRHKCKKWRLCEDVTAPVIYANELLNAVHQIIHGNIKTGIYNWSSANVHYPSFITKHFNWQGEVVRAGTLNLSPMPLLNISKGKQAGLHGI